MAELRRMRVKGVVQISPNGKGSLDEKIERAIAANLRGQGLDTTIQGQITRLAKEEEIQSAHFSRAHENGDVYYHYDIFVGPE